MKSYWKNNKPWIIKLLGALVLVTYPFLIYLSLQKFNEYLLIPLLCIIVAIQVFGGFSSRIISHGLILFLLLATIYTLLANKPDGLLAYPVAVNALMFIYFFTTVVSPPTAIEQIARITEPSLSDKGVKYTQKVTIIWMVFFLINGSISLYSITHSLEFWLIYNGFISYLLIGTLFCIEFIVRKHIQPSEHA